MARLGEHLIAAGLVEADKVDQALRAQVVWGGRLGTNLIELGCIDLDELSRALGQQHSVPAALGRHFDKADPELQAQLPAALAKQFCVVPLVRLSPERIAVVALDPLTPTGMAALAAVYGVDPQEGVVISVAAEMRVLYHLERVYKIARPTRYLRSKKSSITPFPQFDTAVDFDVDVDVEPEIVEDLTPIPATPEPERPVAQVGSADDIAALLDQAIESAITPTPDASEPTGRDRRTYLRTLGDEVAEPTQPPERPSQPRIEAPVGALGRIAIKRVAVTPPRGTEIRAGEPANFAEATRAIKRGRDRDRVAELVIETIERFVPTCDAAMLLVIRGDVAIGWKRFSRGDESWAEVAVPLDQPGIVPTVIARKALARGSSTDLGAIDSLLLRALGVGAGDDLVVAPVSIGPQVMCVLCAATEVDSGTAQLDAVAAAAGVAFTRLIRDASR